MKVVDIIKNSENTVFSFELLPPLKGQDAGKLYRTIEKLLEFNPGYINLTTHRNEVEYRQQPDGSSKKIIVQKRPGTVAIAAAIQHKYNVPVVPHLVCGGFTREETENTLIDLHFLEIDNVLALRGDGLKSEKRFSPEAGGHANANELAQQIANLRQGRYLDPELTNHSPMDFCIGVAGYPEKHGEAVDMEIDLHYLRQKIDAGADYIVTQMFFDNQKYYDFVDRCRGAGITVPIIPGIKPLSLIKQVTELPRIFNISMPEAFSKEVLRCKDNNQAREAGTQWAIEQARDLIKNKVPCLHIYTYGISDNTCQIARAVF